VAKLLRKILWLCITVFIGVLILYPYIRPYLATLDFIAIIIFFYINSIIHEFGHVLAGKLVNFGISRVLFGNGRELGRIKVFGTIFILNTGFGGATCIGKVSPRWIRARFFLFAAGGIVLQMIVGIFCWVLFGFTSDSSTMIHWNNAFIVSNAVMIILNLIPRKINFHGMKLQNDGLMLSRISKITEVEIQEILSAGPNMEAFELLENRQYTAAAAIYQSLIKEYPSTEPTYINYSVCLMKNLQFEKAKEILQNRLQQKNDDRYDALIYNNLAWIYLLEMDEKALPEADRLSNEATEISSHPNFRNTRGSVLIELGDLNAGIDILEQSTNLNKPVHPETNNPTNFMYLAFGYYQKGEIEKSNQYWQHLNPYLSKLEPDDAYLYEKLMQKMNREKENPDETGERRS
jgi:hypothetical protein